MNQIERIIRHMEDFGSITSLEAVNEYGILRLASRIHDIKKLGFPVVKTSEKAKNRYGESVSYARYSLDRSKT